jgi:ABC-type multidrug transport system fused ATPase/permease subunit
VQEYWLAAVVASRNLQALAKRAPPMRNRRSDLPLRIQSGKIVFDSVSVKGALKRVCTEAAPGAHIAVLGPNGSGKSTLLGLVGRLYDPDHGRVLIDGQDVSTVSLSSLRRQVAYVSAEIPLIRGSLRKNLCYGAGQVDIDRLDEVISECELDSLIERKRGGLDACIAESGADLSQGERVRVSLARALLRRPAILILDEAEANLDARAIRVMDGVVNRFGGTVLMATHRPGAIQQCDAAWTLDEGCLQAITPVGSPIGRGQETLILDVRAGRRQPLVLASGLGSVR